MFLALRELQFARGRFALMGTVLALISVLVVLLSGLSSGLVNDGVSGLKSMPVTAFAFDEGTMKDNAFSRSVIEEDQLQPWKDAKGVDAAEPMGVSIVNSTTNDGKQVDLTLFGVETDGFLAPKTSQGEGLGPVNGIVVSDTLKDEGVEIGTVMTLDRIDTELTVVGFTEGQATFGHVDVAYLPLSTWQLIASNTAQPGAPTEATVAAADYSLFSTIAVQAKDGADIDLAAADKAAGTTSMTLTESFNASPGYQAETMTLSMIQVFLYVICALVVGAFFTVWTIQRAGDLAVLRAMGASSRFLLRDSLAQATIVLLVFTGIGVAAGVALGAAMPAAMPFELEAGPIAVASLLTIGLGLLGAGVSVLRITRIDPLAALGGRR
ncbi:ABC transporter permease [Aeromicrobium duanguangcaii]|uniref:ABC transporter permease n=1 Tax=Aeromicrobium duanguangcaii TaxID=2968086 RepID=A0ABY5KGA2_9ACTN|nr:ABC transporter permease [Aeromicrobium duanguangcaii]MCD9153549.1 ABC transporter permease [Aeromicrobium duanguangcaii]MCL3836466.1 ABC transporter permease [Aeromicrobium duanguangcaii]UUI69365.1 ABC transporter permease [Aeromicrobium duanguangcaii]